MAWYRRSKLGFDLSFRSKITIPKPTISHGNQLSNFTFTSSLNVNRGSHSVSNILSLIKSVEPGMRLAICYGKVETIPYTKRKHFLLIPPSVERELGVHSFEKKKAEFEGKVLPVSHPDCCRVTVILKHLLRALKKEDSECGGGGDGGGEGGGGGGGVVVTTVEAVAVAHVVARHGAEWFTRNYWRSLGQQILYMFVKPDLESTSNLPIPLSHRIESEADYIGLMLMASAGYNPRVALKVLKKLWQIEGDSGVQDNIFTHPSTETRIKLLSQAYVMQEAISKYEQAKAGRDVDT